MNKCKRCGIHVLDDTQVCPLCHAVLTLEKDAETVKKPEDREQNTNIYPDVKKKTRGLHKAGRILLFISLVTEAALILINYATFAAAPRYWSAVTGCVIIYLLFTVWDMMSRRQGHIRKIYMQTFVLAALLLLIDVSLGWKGWSLEFGLPCVIYGLEAVIVICMCVNSGGWQHYVLMQVVAVCLSLLDILLHVIGPFAHGHIVLSWIALGIALLMWSGTMIIGDRKAKNELKRKLHI